MQTIYPCFWYDFTAEEAADLYQQALPNTSVVSTLHYPTEELPAFQQGFAGLPLMIELDIDGFTISLFNGGDAFTPNPSFSLMLVFDPATNPVAEEALRHAAKTLGKDGKTVMQLGQYPFSPLYTWIEDKYGVSWQLITPVDSMPDKRPFVLPTFLFGQIDHSRARTALSLYTEVFEDAQIGAVIPYDETAEPVDMGGVVYSEMRLADQWFVAMDAAAEIDFSFTPGASLMVKCTTQEEIDRLWDGLSATPSAEQFGWCRDEFGFSWQIIPNTFQTLCTNPQSYAAMMKMKKIILADLT